MNSQESQYTYLILGAGRQGTAAAYDLARFGQARRITLSDISGERALAAAQRVNDLLKVNVVQGIQLDVLNYDALLRELEISDVALSAVPYFYNLAITQAAIRSHTSLCDMGGNTQIVFQQLALDEMARLAQISIVPDCGMGPGLVNTLGAYAMELLDEPQEIYVYDAGLPQKPVPPWNYQLTFHINGLTNEMDGQAVFIREGKIQYVDTLTEPEWIDFPPLGRLEADVTSGGTSTAPWTFLGKLQRFENKVLRYPGHYEWLRAFKTLGLFNETPIQVGKQTVIPREVYHALLEPKISAVHIEDICIMRVIGKGMKSGKFCTVTIDLVDAYDPITGFTGMERLTGWHCSIMMGFLARGQVRPGVMPNEVAVPASQVMEQVRIRGIQFSVRWN